MGFADYASRRVRRVTRKALQEIGRRGVRDIRDSINEPVVRMRGPRGGLVIIRSDPGEPPYRETKELWRSIRYRVFAMAKNLEDLMIFTALKKALWLEKGTKRGLEPRPFFEPARKRFKSWAPRAFKDLFKQYWTEDSFYNPDPQVDEALPESDME